LTQDAEANAANQWITSNGVLLQLLSMLQAIEIIWENAETYAIDPCEVRIQQETLHDYQPPAFEIDSDITNSQFLHLHAIVVFSIAGY